MKMSVRDRERLIADMLPMLGDIPVQVNTLKEKMSGAQLIMLGTTHARDGSPIIRSKEYDTFTPVMGLVDHKKKLEKIIKEAKTEEQVENDFALYLTKNAESLEAIKTGEITK